MVKSYEELAGAVGRAQLFRSRRRAAADLFAGEPPLLFFDDQPFELKDISASGSGASAPLSDVEEALVRVNRIGVLRLVQSGQDLFRGAARVARAEIRGVQIFSGFALERGQFDLASLRQRNAGIVAATAPDAVAIDVQYKAFCADTLSFVASFLQRIEKNIAPLEASMPATDVDALARDLCAAAAPGWKSIVAQGNAFVIPHQRSKCERLSLKAYTERVLTRALLDGEGWRRTYEKPMGYPGDFRIMNYIYDGDSVGDSVRTKFLHLLSLVGAEPVRTRMLRLAELIVEQGRSFASAGPTPVLSVGAGPAREAVEIMRLSAPDCSWRFTLLDQEEEALEYATAQLASIDEPRRAECRALNASFKDMLDPSPLAAEAGRNSIIYSAGLVDYLNPLLARRFVKRLYQLLHPGGAIIIGNVNDKTSGMMWPSEYVVDWTLFFRNREEMLELASGIPDAEVSIEQDSLDAIYFLIVRKPA